MANLSRDEILETSSKSKTNAEYEVEALKQSYRFSYGLGTLLCIGLALIKLLVAREFDYGIFAVLLTVLGVQNIVQGKKLHIIWRLVLGIILVVLASLFTVMYIGKVAGI